MKNSIGNLLAAFGVLVGLFSLTINAQQFSDWSSPVNLGPAINSVANDQHPTISKDDLTMIFVSDRPGTAGDFDLYVSQRDSTEDPWQPAINLAILNTPFREFAPELSTNGHWLFFHSNRPGGCGNTDIYAAYRSKKRDDYTWETPINLGCTLNTPFQDAGPTVFQDPDSGVFTMYLNRNLNLPPDNEGNDIYVSTCSVPDLDSCNRNQLWTAATIVFELSSPVRDTRTAIRRRDGLEMIITSSRVGGCGSQDLWSSTRPTTADPWSIPVNIDPINPATGTPTCVTNSTALDGAMAISWDGTDLYFFSTRTGGLGGADLWHSTRTKIRP
jgi:WD40-like Beta Propeller Repeat